MKRIVLLSVTLLASSLYGADATAPAKLNTAAAFSRLKSLAGEWQADTDMGKMQMSLEVIAGGTALVSRERGDNMPEMLTVFHLDGDRLMLTHYCMAGNQPRMQAAAYDPASGELEFRYLDATNLASPTAGHMHHAVFRFVDDRHLISEWQFHENGQVKMTESAKFTRVR